MITLLLLLCLIYLICYPYFENQIKSWLHFWSDAEIVMQGTAVVLLIAMIYFQWQGNEKGFGIGFMLCQLWLTMLLFGLLTYLAQDKD